MDNMKRQKYMILEDQPLVQKGGQYAAGHRVEGNY